MRTGVEVAPVLVEADVVVDLGDDLFRPLLAALVIPLDTQVLELALGLVAVVGRRAGNVDLGLPVGGHQELDQEDGVPPFVAVDQRLAVHHVRLAAVRMGAFTGPHPHPHAQDMTDPGA
jgi:hypothetical protein